jgi:5-methylcytosine-specific restriction endonuclease McrA
METELNLETQSVISDITDVCTTTNSISSGDIIKKVDEIRAKTETELNKLTIDALKEKCKELNIPGISKLKKPELVQSLLSEYMKLWSVLSKDKKTNELKSICKTYNIKATTGLKKEEICLLILNHCSVHLIFKLDFAKVPDEPTQKVKPDPATIGKPPGDDISSNNAGKPKKLTAIEELEKQRLEIESKLTEELNKQKKIEEDEKKAKLEQEQQRIEEEKKKEKEELKKKKQSIPKQVRLIVWNHYIGEDIIKHRCLCCKKVIITNTNFDVGHVLSEKNGGTHEINNLRPICGACNHSMGTENMVDFVVKYGLYIG